MTYEVWCGIYLGLTSHSTQYRSFRRRDLMRTLYEQVRHVFCRIWLLLRCQIIRRLTGTEDQRSATLVRLEVLSSCTSDKPPPRSAYCTPTRTDQWIRASPIAALLDNVVVLLPTCQSHVDRTMDKQPPCSFAFLFLRHYI